MSYADRKNVMAKKQIAAMSKWANRPRADQPEITEQRRALWQALNQFITERGGFVTSVQFASPIRIEVPMGSALPAKLTEAGYDLAFREQTTRIGAPVSEPDRWGRPRNVNGGYGFHTVDVFELGLPR